MRRLSRERAQSRVQGCWAGLRPSRLPESPHRPKARAAGLAGTVSATMLQLGQGVSLASRELQTQRASAHSDGLLSPVSLCVCQEDWGWHGP